MTAHLKDGTPDLSVAEIEQQIEAMKLEAHRTDSWMTSRARTKMQELEDRDTALRDAFQAGYRMGADSNTWILLLLVLIPLAIAYPFM